MHIASKSVTVPHMTQNARGFRIVYHDGEPNHCPGCGRQQWIVGRVTAECVFCETALPLEHVSGFGFSPRFGTSHAAGAMSSDLQPVI